MDLKKKQERLREIYDRFEREVSGFKSQAVCGLGCAFCCTYMGDIDITTLEGLIIRGKIDTFSDSVKELILNGVEEDRKKKKSGIKSRCPFLAEKGACLIYDVRPFSCRQLYSVRKCDDKGPMVHRQAVDLARSTVREIQKLDDTGYSGHHSYIIHLLDQSDFEKLYRAGGFDPARISEYGKLHSISINRSVNNPCKSKK